MMTNGDKLRKYCSYQDRSCLEVRRKMAQLLVPAEEAENLLAELIEEKYVDDARFAESFIRGKMLIKRWGRVKIKVELAQRGVASDIIKQKIDEMDDDIYIGNLKYLVEKWNRENPGGEREKMFRFLLSKGYEYAEINSVIK